MKERMFTREEALKIAISVIDDDEELYDSLPGDGQDDFILGNLCARLKEAFGKASRG